MKLYRLDPAFRGRFDGTPETQGRKFMAALKLAIISLNYEDGLAPTLKLLGIRHRQLGIKIRHYRMMTKALLWTFEQSLEKRFTRETKDAWSALLTQITRTLSGGDAAYCGALAAPPPELTTFTDTAPFSSTVISTSWLGSSTCVLPSTSS